MRPGATALAASLLAIGLGHELSAQPPAEDWHAAVVKAVEHRRYGVRRAAANKIARAGDAAVPAIRAYQVREGRDAIPLLLVDGIANADTKGLETIRLLEDWARDRAFYWRAQALDGLASRELPSQRPRFRAAVEDPSHLYRAAGARGLYLLDPSGAGAQQAREMMRSDPDPRARQRLAEFLFARGERDAAPVLVAALTREDSFLGDPWGKRLAQSALRALQRGGGEPIGYDLSRPAHDPENAAALDRLRARLRAGTEVWSEPDVAPPLPGVDGGVEIRSCRNGDLFVRWSAASRTLTFGLDPRTHVRLSPEAAIAVDRAWGRIPAGRATHGRVVCDYAQVAGGSPERRHKAAPGALPTEVAAWLKAVAAGLEMSSRRRLAGEIRSRMRQFETE